MLFNIYQVNPDHSEEASRRLFTDFARIGGKIDATMYKKVYVGDHPELKTLDDIFQKFNLGRIPTLQGHSLSVSDIVEVLEDTDKVFKGCYFCDSIGWRVVTPDFQSDKAAPMTGLRTVYIRPGCRPVETHVWEKLRFLQDAVSDHGEESLIEISYPFDEDIILVGNEEAKLNGMKGNRRIAESVYAGPIFLLRDTEDGENFAGLTDNDVVKYMRLFAEPEDISNDEVQADCGFTIFGF